MEKKFGAGRLFYFFRACFYLHKCPFFSFFRRNCLKFSITLKLQFCSTLISVIKKVATEFKIAASINWYKQRTNNVKVATLVLNTKKWLKQLFFTKNGGKSTPAINTQCNYRTNYSIKDSYWTIEHLMLLLLNDCFRICTHLLQQKVCFVVLLKKK